MKIHLIAIGGTGMAPLACLLDQAGHEVRGSDGPLYPPMSDLLAAAGIRPWVGYDAAHLDPPPDLVVVGNAVPRTNPEAEAAERLGIPRISMPQALARFFLAGRKPLVVAGTHGKTTTTALAAWVYADCGRDPGFLIGGVPRSLDASFRRGGGERFIIEGDEYNASYFDRGAKFLHYRPETLILTGVEHDHADLYPTWESLLEAYRQLVALLPAGGRLIACGDSADVRRLADRAPCAVTTYGLDSGNDLRPSGSLEADGPHTLFRIDDPEEGEIEVTLPLSGEHNVVNSLAVWAAARGDGLPAAEVAAALGRFGGVKRRMEELGEEAGVVVVEDFAHHPTAVGATLAALARRYPDRRLVAVFEPRTNSAGRAVFYDAYRRAFAAADRVFLAPIFHAAKLAAGEAIDLGRLAADLTAAGTPAAWAPSVDRLLDDVAAEAAPGDLVVSMSSGAFERFPLRLLERLRARE